MTSDKNNCAIGFAVSDGDARQPYQAPRLVEFGNVARLTQAGTMAQQEDLIQNGWCVFPNASGNMCCPWQGRAWHAT